MTVTLEQYEQAERTLFLHEGRIGLRVHAVVTAVVVTSLVLVNIIVANEFPWSAFVALGMSIGLFFHWFGYRRAETDIRDRQARIEASVRDLAAHV